MSEISGQSFSFFLPFVALTFSFVALILGLACIWRAEHRLKTFLKLIITVLVLGTARRVFELVGLEQEEDWSKILLAMGLVTSFLFMVAFLEMFRIIRIVTKEKKGKL